MGNSQTRHQSEPTASSSRNRSAPKPVTIAPVSIDRGSTLPFGKLYPSAPDDYDKNVLIQAILMRRLAPFYQGVEELPEFPAEEEKASRTSETNPVPEGIQPPSAALSDQTSQSSLPYRAPSGTQSGADILEPPKAATLPRAVSSGDSQHQPHQGLTLTSQHQTPRRSCSSQSSELVSHKRSFGASLKTSLRGRRPSESSHSGLNPSARSTSTSSSKDVSHVGATSTTAPPESSQISEKALWDGAMECPICFLYYPRNMNFTRCCDQPICTDCFIQIKRPESTFEPACCPYCVMPDLGIVYDPFDSPNYRARYQLPDPNVPNQVAGESSGEKLPPIGRRSMNRKANVFLSDELRPDWEKRKQQLALERSIQQRRLAMGLAQRARIPIFDEREISGAATAAAVLFEGLSGMSQGGQANERPSRSHRDQRRDFAYLQTMRHIGADIEELMMMEAIRQSMQEAEEQQRRQQEEEARLLAEQLETSAAMAESVPPTSADNPVEQQPSHEPVPTVTDALSSPTDTLDDEPLLGRKERLLSEKKEEEQPISDRLEDLKLESEGNAKNAFHPEIKTQSESTTQAEPASASNS